MRAPGEATGMMALEIAIDEMAEKLGLDPIEFRIINDTQVVPTVRSRPSSDDPQAMKGAGASAATPGLRFSQRQLVQVPARRRRTLRLEQAKPGARQVARRALADRHRRCGSVSRQPWSRSRPRACGSIAMASSPSRRT